MGLALESRLSAKPKEQPRRLRQEANPAVAAQVPPYQHQLVVGPTFSRANGVPGVSQKHKLQSHPNPIGHRSMCKLHSGAFGMPMRQAGDAFSGSSTSDGGMPLPTR